jgi:hypothetical protein
LPTSNPHTSKCKDKTIPIYNFILHKIFDNHYLFTIDKKNA